jgi:hypothetical protein
MTPWNNGGSTDEMCIDDYCVLKGGPSHFRSRHIIFSSRAGFLLSILFSPHWRLGICSEQSRVMINRSGSGQDRERVKKEEERVMTSSLGDPLYLSAVR